MPAPDSVLKLCETFAAHREHYRSSGYNETELRREFLDPFFKSLGWDIDNKQGYADAYKDVIHEDAIKVGGNTKAPDYCFRIGGARKFFLEAKKPSVNIRDDISPAYQLRRYAWSAKLPLSILSDFEEFAIYDCRAKPFPKDKPSASRTFYCTFDQFAEKWGQIAAIFSREAVLKGSFDKYAESTKGKRGTAEVDADFLAEIERWRDLLARNFALRNPSLTVRDLNFAVQKTIDRIIFLRICEDRGTEDYERLRKRLSGKDLYPVLLDEFRRADDRYNSGLFHFTSEKGRANAPDTLTTSLALDDKVIADIVRNLYYPDSSFEFSVMPADILGQVYEQFLGKTIRLTTSHQAKIEEKPEVRKAGGVYYTPKYIVDHIVENTLGRLLNVGATEDRPHSPTPLPLPIPEAAKLKVVDPACGSGSFLIVAYQYLLDWHRDQYTLDPATLLPDEAKAARHAKGASPVIYQGNGGEWKLTIAERKRILLNNIHGVDIDSQAVEVTKLSLLLKVLEGETSTTAQRDLFKERQRILPDLGNNIKCGNSLIGPDFYDQPDLPVLDDEAKFRINVFDWKLAFPQVFQQGGFDCVIGNPPYVLLQGDNRDDNQLGYFRKIYKVASYKLDTYHLFIEKAADLMATGGRSAYITPSNYLSNNFLEPLRDLLLTEVCLESLMIFDYPVFAGVSVDTAIFVASKQKRSNHEIRISKVGSAQTINEPTDSGLSLANALQRPGKLLLGESGAASKDLIGKIKSKGVPLGGLSTVNFGKQLRNRKIYTEDVINVGESKDDIPKSHVACLTGSNIARYMLEWEGLACLRSEEARSGGCWDAEVHDSPGKLICRQIGKRPFFALDPKGYHCLNTAFMVLNRMEDLSNLYLLGILNSQLLGFYWEDQFYDQRKTFPKIKGTYLKQLPIRPIAPEDVELHGKMVTLVESMLSLHSRQAAERNPDTQRMLATEIAATDRRIDRLVYELYGLTDEEIALVEA